MDSNETFVNKESKIYKKSYLQSELKTFVNFKASIECDIIKEEIDDICYDCFRLHEEYDIDTLMKADLKVNHAIKNMMKNTLEVTNSLIEKNSFNISLREWNDYEDILRCYIERVLEYYYKKRPQKCKIDGVYEKRYYYKHDIYFNKWELVFNRLSVVNHIQMNYAKQMYKFNKKSIYQNTYHLSILAAILSIISILDIIINIIK